MVDKELLERIADAACGADELADFCVNLDEREYDLDGSFQKYYRLGRILHAIERFERGEIDVEYLAAWATAYKWIIMATEWERPDGVNGPIGYSDCLVEMISNTLDDLAFLEDLYPKEEWTEWLKKDYKKTFREYDYVLSTLGEWTAFHAVIEPPEDFELDNFPDVSFLGVNESKKLFVQFTIFGFIPDVKRIKEPKIPPEKMTEKIVALKDAGYREPTV